MSTNDETIDRALDYHRQGQFAPAEQLYRQVLQQNPGNADAWHLLGTLSHQTGRHEEAIKLISHAIRLHGAAPVMHNNLGEACRTLGRYSDAMAAYRQAIRLRPDFAEAYNNLGTVHQNQDQVEEALACYDRAIELQPTYANAHYNRGRALLGLGDFSRGWAEYEWRWKRPEIFRPPRLQPEWDGSPLAGRILLVEAEQGLGDTLQFIRYLPLAASCGGNVVAQVQGALLPLLLQSGFGDLVSQETPTPKFDVYTALLSLPCLLGTTLETIPAQVPYLCADSRLREQWRGRLSGASGFKIGIHWRSGTVSPLRGRSFPLTALAPVAELPGTCLVSLQKGPGTEQIPAVGFRVMDFSSELDEANGSFMDTAALMNELDLVITCDTATAHLGGGMAVPVWVVLPHAADWRWLRGRTDSPWYPTMRLFPQTRQGDWADVFARMAEALFNLLAAGKTP